MSRSYSTSLRPSLRLVLCAPIFVAVLVGCGSEEQTPVAPVRQVKIEKAPEDPTAKMAVAIEAGKSDGALVLKYDVLSRPVVDLPVEIELALVPKLGADSMAVKFSGSTGLDLSADSAPSIDNLKPGSVERVRVSATAKEPNVYYVTINATLYSAGVSSPHTFAIPLIFSMPAADEPAAAEGGSAPTPTAEPSKS